MLHDYHKHENNQNYNFNQKKTTKGGLVPNPNHETRQINKNKNRTSANKNPTKLYSKAKTNKVMIKKHIQDWC
jgi:hypothetical protein